MFEDCEREVLNNLNLYEENRFAISIDEVGRGSLFGPVTVGGVLFPLKAVDNFSNHSLYNQIKDSKLLTPKKRDDLFEQIKQSKNKNTFLTDISHASVQYIEKHNINQAIKYAAYKLVHKLIYKKNISTSDVAYILFDGNYKFKFPDYFMSRTMPIIFTKKKGDLKCFTIAMASIIAKVTRDKMIIKSAERFPNYFLEKNMGYGTKQHREAIVKKGISQFHRRTFCQKILEN